MNENDITDLLSSTLGGDLARQDFQERLLQNSTAAFARSRLFHKRLKVTGLILMIATITTSAFLLGRFSVIGKNSQQIIVKQSNSDDNNISVSKDLVAWLDAAKFFTQLGMEERAEFSYKQASQLIPLDIMQNSVADTGQIIELAKILNDYDENNLKVSEQEEQKALFEITNKILAHNFGD